MMNDKTDDKKRGNPAGETGGAAEPLQEELRILLDQEMQEHVDRLKRLQAEFDNYKKRMARETATIEARITDQAILEFLPLRDSLERAFVVYEENQDTEALIAGFEQIRAQFEQILAARGVERIDCIGALFDPALHEALLSVDSNENKNTIVDELTPGYLRDGHPLRVSRVIVSRGPSDGAEEEEQ